MKGLILEGVKKIKKDFEEFSLKTVDVSYTDSLGENYFSGSNGKEYSVIKEASFIEKRDINLIDLIIEAVEGENDIDEYSDKVDYLLGTKPHQILSVSKVVYRKNKIVFSCGNEECIGCFNMFTCSKNQKEKMLFVVDVQPQYIRFSFRDENSEKNVVGTNSSNKIRVKKNDHLNVLFGKLLYLIVDENYSINGFRCKK
ncbi:MAG: hypothetical protein ACRCX2_01660 [Paraclostridium sp.]